MYTKNNTCLSLRGALATKQSQPEIATGSTQYYLSTTLAMTEHIINLYLSTEKCQLKTINYLINRQASRLSVNYKKRAQFIVPLHLNSSFFDAIPDTRYEILYTNKMEDKKNGIS